MKTRILSLVLAAIMVVSMAAVFSFASSAEEVEGLTVTVGTVYAAPGTTASIDVYVSAKSLPATHQTLRNWQFDFAGAQGTGDEGTEYYVSGGSAYAFFNEADNTYGNTANTGLNCGTAAQILSRGGWKIASLGFAVPADASGEIEVSITKVTAITFEDSSDNQYKVPAEATVVAGKIIVVDSVEGVTEDDETEGNYVVPFLSADGKTLITSGLNADGDVALNGSYTVLTVPATIADVADAIDGVTAETIVLKSTVLEKGDATAVAGNGSSTSPINVYIHKRANGSDTTADAFDQLSNANKKKVNVQNILNAMTDATVEGRNVTFVAGIAVDDLDFTDMVIVADFGGGKVKESGSFTSVYSTIKGYASTDEETAGSQGIAHADGFTYLAGLKVKNVPVGTYTVTLTLFATTADVNGCPIVVTSDPVTVDVTVNG